MRAVCALVSASLLASFGAAQERPNIVWLTVEDMSPWIPCYGDETVPTPNLDALAAASVRYVNAFATSPVCAPARSSLITGMYATRMGTMHHRTGNPSRAALDRDPAAYESIPSYEGVPPAFVRCFPEHLRAAGYFCTNRSKTDYQFRAPATVWDASGPQAHWRLRPAGAPFFAVFNYTGTHESQAFPGATRRGDPMDPLEVVVPPIYPDTPSVREALARTYENIRAMDAWVGERLAELEAAELLGSTVVFFFSDHGVGLPRGKRSPYDLGTRVPLLVRHPDGRGAGTSDSRVVSFVDFGPAVLSLAGLEPDVRLDGTPFLGVHDRPGRGLAFAHADRFDSVRDRARAVSDGRFRYVHNFDPQLPHLLSNAYRDRLPMMRDLYALQRDGSQDGALWQVASSRRPAEELYDSETDPWETQNLVGSPGHAETLARLRRALEEWIEETGDLGLVLPERDMVENHLWPGGVQPATAAPSLRIEDGRGILTSATPGASIGYRFAEGESWTVYRGGFPVGESTRLQAIAHRIGFAPATSSFALP